MTVPTTFDVQTKIDSDAGIIKCEQWPRGAQVARVNDVPLTYSIGHSG